jgi:polysaccharide biosynthesis/export protein VpsN
MKTRMNYFLLTVSFLAFSTSLLAQDTAVYTLALGDVVSINVFDEPDLSFPEVKITDTGKIPFPFLGEIQATGQTTKQIQESLVEGLRPDYLVDPTVSVSIVKYRDFFLTGEVDRPGSIPYQPGLTLRQAITLAGGLTERASTNKMSLISTGNTGDSERVDLNYVIKPGDTITIEESFF